MTKVKKNFKQDYLGLFLSFLYSVALSFSLTLSFDPKTSIIKGLIIIVITYILLYICFLNKIIRRITLFLLISVFIGISAYAVINWSSISPFLTSLSEWFYDYAYGFSTSVPEYVNLLLAGVYVLVSALSYLLTYRYFSSIISFVAGSLVYVVQVAAGFFDYKDGVVYCFFIFIFVNIAFFLKGVYIRRVKTANSSKEKKTVDFAPLASFILFMLPFSLLISVVTINIPCSDRPLRSAWADNKLYEIEQYYNYLTRRYTEYDYFSISKTGFAEDGKLGGNVNIDKTEIMTVQTALGGIYLRGTSKSYYTGKEWLNSSSVAPFDYIGNETKEPDVSMESTVFNYGMNMLGGGREALMNNFRYTLCNVKFIRLKTKSLFMPLHAVNFTFPPNYELSSSLYVDNNDIYTTSSTNEDGFNYGFNFYYLRFLDNSMTNILNRATTGFFDALSLNKVFTVNMNVRPDSENSEEIEILSITDKAGETMQYTFSGSASNTATLRFYHENALVVLRNFSCIIDQVGNTANVTYHCLVNGETHNFSSIVKCTPVDDGSYNITISGDVFEHIATTEVMNDIIEYTEDVRNTYLQLPDSLPERVRQLSLDITKDCTTDYQKAKAIETYLSENYTYTLTPGAMRRDVDFVDDFLFETKKGYCTYYATSMTVMLRCVGVPARYTEGFKLDSTSNALSKYTVTNENAHAWPEVYLEGYGWLVFEPTTKYTKEFYESLDRAMSSAPEEKTPPPYLPEDPYDNEPEESSTPLPVVTEKPTWNVLDMLSNVYFIIGYAVVGLFILLMLINYIRIKFELYFVKRKPARKSIFYLYKKYLKILDYMGCKRLPYETPSEYAIKVSDTLYMDITAATVLFGKAMYGFDEISDEERNQMINEYEEIYSNLLRLKGRFKLFVLRYVVGRF